MEAPKKDIDKREYVRWAYRLFLDREPENAEVLDRVFQDTQSLRKIFMGSVEYTQKNIDIVDESEEKWVFYDTSFHFRIYVNLMETAICRPVLFDSYEPSETKLLQTLIRKDDHVLDIGANIGFHTLLMATLVEEGGMVFAFEPIPFLNHALCNSIKENSFHHIKVFDAALSNKQGHFEMIYLPYAENAGGPFLNVHQETLAGHNTIQVQTMKLDDLRFEKTIDFIKMDAEGAEAMILDGGREFFKAHRPKILSEVHPFQLQRVSNISAVQYLRQLNDVGYACYNINCWDEKITNWDEETIGNILCVDADEGEDWKILLKSGSRA